MHRVSEFVTCLLVLIVCSEAAVSDEDICLYDVPTPPREEKTTALLQVHKGVSSPDQPHTRGAKAPQHAAHMKIIFEQEQQVQALEQGAASSRKPEALQGAANSHKSKETSAGSAEEVLKRQQAPEKKAPQAAPQKSQSQGHVSSSGSNKAPSHLPKGRAQETMHHSSKVSSELPRGKNPEKKHHSSKASTELPKGMLDPKSQAKKHHKRGASSQLPRGNTQEKKHHGSNASSEPPKGKFQEDAHHNSASSELPKGKSPEKKHHSKKHYDYDVHADMASKPSMPDSTNHAALNQADGHSAVLMSQKRADGFKVHNFAVEVMARIGGVVRNQAGFDAFLEAQNVEVVQQPLNALLNQYRLEASKEDGWLLLPPPNKGPVLRSFIRSDPWDCNFIPAGDARGGSCGLEVDSLELSPSTLHCGLQCSIEHANAYRTLQSIGSLPCCTTPPFCSAPACNLLHEPERVCEKRSPEENVAYMKQNDTWPSYHGWGGSFELDTLKLIDSLGCKDASGCPEKMFDLAIDLGANTGYYTEKLSVRNFAKNYIMIEANPRYANALRERWGTDSWKEKWFTDQVKQPNGNAYPDFEIINHALSNHSEGLLNMCETETSLEEFGCSVPIASVDSIIAEGLTPAFVEHVKDAKSAYIKIDTEGMDELVLRGMEGLLAETRGEYEDKSPRFLVNFLQFEFSPALMKKAKDREAFAEYDIESVTKFLESQGFETFMIGPRYLPLSHGSWNDEFKTWTADPDNNAGARLNYPKFDDRVCSWCATMTEPSFTSDVFAIRSTHPRASELKVALGACKESKEFDLRDPQYIF